MRVLTQTLPSLILAAALAFASAARAEAPTATITVTGTGTVQVVPDLATISLGVTTHGDTAAAAMSANSAAVKAVIDRLTAAGIGERDMQTSNLSLNPNWVSNSSGTAQEVQGYIASNMLTVQVKDMDATGAVLDAAVTDGANTLNGLTFGLQNPGPKEDEARQAAVGDALARAKLLTAAAGVTLGPILSISEGGAAQPYPQPMYRMADQAMAVPVAGGEVGVSASVTIIWQIQ